MYLCTDFIETLVQNIYQTAKMQFGMYVIGSFGNKMVANTYQNKKSTIWYVRRL